MSWGYEWRPYVSVATRRRQALKKMESLRKKGVDIQPVEIEGRKIAKTFWGEAWCDHIESFHDYENRLPRGRTYVRNGSVCHLAIAPGKVEAKVSGSELYTVTVQIKKLAAEKWTGVKRRCAGRIGSLIELLQGRLSGKVMEVVTDRQDGLFPLSGEMTFKCSCPDWASMCKHVAATLYGVGARLDHKPELLFHLRGVDHEELIAADAEAAMSEATAGGTSKRLAAESLSDVFGIELAEADNAADDRGVDDHGADDHGTEPLPSEDGTKKAKKQPRKTAKKQSPIQKKTAIKKNAAKKTTAKKTTAKRVVMRRAKSGEVSYLDGKEGGDSCRPPHKPKAVVAAAATARKNRAAKSPAAKLPAAPKAAVKKAALKQPRISRRKSVPQKSVPPREEQLHDVPEQQRNGGE